MTTGKKAFVWAGLGCSAFCCLGVTIPVWIVLNGGDNLDRAITDYRKQGLPWTASEVESDGPTADAVNAAPILNRAFIKFDEKRALSESSKAWTMLGDGDNAGVEEIVTHYAAEIALAKGAAQLPRADFHKDWDYGPELLFPELGAIKGLGRLLADRAVLEARQGKVAASVSDLTDEWKLSGLVGREPTLFALLVQISMRAGMLSAVEQCITTYRDQPANLSALKVMLAKLTDETDFRHTVRGEAYMGLVILRNGSTFRNRLLRNSEESKLPPIDPKTLRRNGAPAGIIERFTGGKLLKAYVQLDDIARKDAGDPAQLDTDLKAFDMEISKDNSLTAFYRNIVLPVYTQVGQAMSEDVARKRTTRALVEAMLQKAKTGRYPIKISDIPGTWVDPFDGEPLRIKSDPRSIRIYSVGPNRKDDGGIAQIEAAGSSDYDIVAGYPPPARKKAK